MKKLAPWRRFAAVALAFAVAMGVSAPVESSTSRRTDVERMIEELERVLGPGAVEVRRGNRAGTPARPERPATSDEGLELAIVAEMNARRAAYGLGPLALEPRLSSAAGDRAEDMFARRYFDHAGPDGRSPFLTVTANGYRYRTVGENLAVGYRGARAVVDGWMRSPGHRANILGRDYRDVGIALHEGSPVRGSGGPTVVALYAAER